MNKKNKILISAGVITPVAILAITLPIVLTKKSDNNSSNKQLDELVAKIKKRNLIISSPTDLNLTKTIDKEKIINKIIELNSLKPEDKKFISIEAMTGIINKDGINIKVTITINSNSKTNITFLVKIASVINGVFNSRVDFKKEVEKYSKGSDYKTKISDPDMISDAYINLDGVKLTDDVRLNFDDFNRIQWKGVINLNDKNNPFKGDISMKNIQFNWIGDLDMSKVTKWPNGKINNYPKTYLRGYNEKTNVGTSLFSGDMTKMELKMDFQEKNHKNNKIDVSSVTKWFDVKNLTWEGFRGDLYKNIKNNPFVGNLSGKTLKNNYYDSIDLSKITHHAKEYIHSSFKNSISNNKFFKGDLTGVGFVRNDFSGVDLSNVTKWTIGQGGASNFIVYGNRINRNTKGDIVKLLTNTKDGRFKLQGKKGIYDAPGFDKDMKDKYKKGYFKNKDNIIKYMPKIEKIYENLKDFTIGGWKFFTHDFFGRDVSKWNYGGKRVQSDGTVWKIFFTDFTGVTGFEKINKDYKNITDWVVGEIIPHIRATATGVNKGTNIFQELEMDTINFFSFRWKDDPNDAKYKYLYQLYENKWPKN